MIIKRWVCESINWIRNVLTRCLYGNVVVVVEVDASVLLGGVVRNAE
jgi:hypothetical protein